MDHQVAGGKIARMSRRLALALVPALHLGLASCVVSGQTLKIVQ
jgi:hypothetical protein